MSAGKETRIIDLPEKWPERLGIIAGGGDIPPKLLNTCLGHNTMPFVVGIKGQVDKVDTNEIFRIGQANSIVQYFKTNEVTDIVMIGAVKRPSFWSLMPDWTTFKFFLRIWRNRSGDSGLLDAAKQELNKRGFNLRAAHEFLPELLMQKKIYNGADVLETYEADITAGVTTAKKLGLEDKGQAVIVKGGEVVAREDKRGTSAMIRKHGQEGALLVKMCKPQQDHALDIPTIGLETLKLCADKQMAGVVGEAGATYLVNDEECTQYATQNNLLLIGVGVNA